MSPRPPDDARPSRPLDQGSSPPPSDGDAGDAPDDVQWAADGGEPGEEMAPGDTAAADGVESGEGAIPGDPAFADETESGEGPLGERATPGDPAFADEAPLEAGAGEGAGAKTPGRPAAAGPHSEEDEWVVSDDEDPVDPTAVAAAVAAAAALEARRAPTEPVLVPGLSDDAERTALLIEFLRDQERRAQRWVQKPRRRTPPATTLGALVLVVASIWLWLLPPQWVQPNLPPPVPVELQEAGLRLGMYLQAQQIEAFRRQRGRLPDALHETGEPVPGMYYRRLNAREYRLHGVTPRLALTYVSTDSLTVFLSDAHRVVGFGPGR